MLLIYRNSADQNPIIYSDSYLWHTQPYTDKTNMLEDGALGRIRVEDLSGHMVYDEKYEFAMQDGKNLHIYLKNGMKAIFRGYLCQD